MLLTIVNVENTLIGEWCVLLLKTRGTGTVWSFVVSGFHSVLRTPVFAMKSYRTTDCFNSRQLFDIY